jgi:FMN phosphatase YigB (HAD superfamily)
LRLQAFELVLEQVGSTPAHTIFVDDSLRNIAAAHELGIFTVLVSPKLAAQQPHHVPGADLVVSSFEQLPQVLPQLFVSSEPKLADEVVHTGVPVRVMAS